MRELRDQIRTTLRRNCVLSCIPRYMRGHHFSYTNEKRPIFQGLLRAGNRIRTGDVQLGKLTLYQLSYSRIKSTPQI